jgi:ATP-dependent Clp protease, protease subunit
MRDAFSLLLLTLVSFALAGPAKADTLGSELPPVVVEAPPAEETTSAPSAALERAEATSSGAEAAPAAEELASSSASTPASASITVAVPRAAMVGTSPYQDEELEALRKERDRLMMENSIRTERLRKEMSDLQAERDRLALENNLERERLQHELAEKRAELERSSVEVEAYTRRAALRLAEHREQLEADLLQLRGEEERLRLANAVAAQRIEGQMGELRFREAEFKLEKTTMEMDIARLQAELLRRERQDQLVDLAPENRNYQADPFVNGRLVVSDRRIALNGPIWEGTARHVVERIDFYNNQNTEFPIFLVIDSSPGGSVMAGDRILKAMKGSQAPVYVVVRSFAASMAATIATLADRSFAYPNAIILHHQMSGMLFGNLTQQREALEFAQVWWQRMAKPIAAKMGISLEEYTSMMYQRSSDGDWKEFADEAKRLKWVDEVVDQIWETSVARNPDSGGSPRGAYGLELEEKRDQAGNAFALLPRLQPFDYYYLYNPDSYYRIR